MKKLFVVVVDNYFPALCDITIPRIRKYAEKIGAEFHLITERKYPDFPAPYEKLQIFELGKDADYNILIDCDMLIGDKMYDISTVVPTNYIGVWMSYNASTYYNDLTHIKDDRNVGIATNMLVVPGALHSVFKPLDVPWSIAKSSVKREFIIDEYCFSRNLAQHKYNFAGVIYPGAADVLFKHLNFTTDSVSKELALNEALTFISKTDPAQ